MKVGHWFVLQHLGLKLSDVKPMRCTKLIQPQIHKTCIVPGTLRKYWLHICSFTPRWGTEMKRSSKCSSGCVLCVCTSCFHAAPLSFDTTPPALKKFFEPVGGEFFRMFSKSFCCSSLNFITCQTIAFEVFPVNSKQPEVTRRQIRAVGRAWNNLKSDALYRRWSDSTSVGSGVIMFSPPPPPPTKAIYSLFQPL
jgi:hypothetical protein